MLERLEAKFENSTKYSSTHCEQSLQSYLGILSHANERELSTLLKNRFGGLAKKELEEQNSPKP